MKYNKSEIMKEAWAWHRKYSGYTFADCLRRAWKLAKEAWMEAHKTPFEREAVMNYNGTEVYFRRWEAYGKRRVYCNYGSGDGYFDINTRKIWAGKKSTPVIEQFLRFYEVA